MTKTAQSAEVKKSVRSHYGKKVAHMTKECCVEHSKDLHSLSIAALSLGLGSPTRFPRIDPGDCVLDLGCGAGADLMRAAKRTGRYGLAIGVDITLEAAFRARVLWKKDLQNLAFFVAEAERLPFKAGSFDVVLSNCVINLCTDKLRVFEEIYRVLRCEGHLSIVDIVSLGPLSDQVRSSPALWAECVAGAITPRAYISLMRKTGFAGVEILSTMRFRYSADDIDRVKTWLHGLSNNPNVINEIDGRIGSIAAIAIKV